MRSGFYKYINTDILYEGHEVQKDLLTGNCQITGKAKSNKAIGYFAYIELLNGFCKSVFWTKKEVEAHAKRYSKSYTSSFSPWKSDFDQMATKTVLTALLKKYGILSVEMASALGSPDIDERTPEEQLSDSVRDLANKEVIDLKPDHEFPTETNEGPEPMSDEEKSEVLEEEAKGAAPDF